MTMSGYSNAVVDVMLGWLKGFANWVLRLFNLAGNAKTSPLLWLSHNWLKLLIFFLVLGVVLDRLIWLIRWRPYWVWFRKERVIVNDERFLKADGLDIREKKDDDLDKNWGEQDYVVASTVVKRRNGQKSRGAVVRGGRRPVNAKRKSSAQAGGRVQRHAASKTARASDDPKRAQAEAKARHHAGGVSSDDLFGIHPERPDVSDFYEDEVFNVSNLPVPDSDEGKQRG